MKVSRTHESFQDTWKDCRAPQPGKLRPCSTASRFTVILKEDFSFAERERLTVCSNSQFRLNLREDLNQSGVSGAEMW